MRDLDTPPSTMAKAAEDGHSREDTTSARALVATLEERDGWSLQDFDRDRIWRGPGAWFPVALPPLMAAISAGLGSLSLMLMVAGGGGVWWQLGIPVVWVNALTFGAFEGLVMLHVLRRMEDSPPVGPVELARDSVGWIASVTGLRLLLGVLVQLSMTALLALANATGLGVAPLFMAHGLVFSWLWLHWLSAHVLERRGLFEATVEGTGRAINNLLRLPAALSPHPDLVGRARETGLLTTLLVLHGGIWFAHRILSTFSLRGLPLLESLGTDLGILVTALPVWVASTASLILTALCLPRWAYHYLAVLELRGEGSEQLDGGLGP